MFACNGILFNHESKRRGETFVTRKITMGLCNISFGLEKCLHLGNLDSLRDWGHAMDYAEMQWMMMQKKEPKDYVIKTLKNEIAAIDKAIDQTRKQLADLTTTSVGKTPTAEFKKLSDNIVTLTKDKANKTQLLSTTIATLNNLISTTPELVEAPKYRVRGFFPIPTRPL